MKICLKIKYLMNLAYKYSKVNKLIIKKKIQKIIYLMINNKINY